MESLDNRFTSQVDFKTVGGTLYTTINLFVKDILSTLKKTLITKNSEQRIVSFESTVVIFSAVSKLLL